MSRMRENKKNAKTARQMRQRHSDVLIELRKLRRSVQLLERRSLFIEDIAEDLVGELPDDPAEIKLAAEAKEPRASTTTAAGAEEAPPMAVAVEKALPEAPAVEKAPPEESPAEVAAVEESPAEVATMEEALTAMEEASSEVSDVNLVEEASSEAASVEEVPAAVSPVDCASPASTAAEAKTRAQNQMKNKVAFVTSYLCTTNAKLVHRGIRMARLTMTREKSDFVQEFLARQSLNLLVRFLQPETSIVQQERDQSPLNSLRLDSAKALLTIALESKEAAAAVADAGAIPRLVHFTRCFGHVEVEVIQQALMTMGVIAKAGPDYRDMVLRSGALPPMLELLKTSHWAALINHIAFALRRLCMHAEKPLDVDLIKPALCILLSFLKCPDPSIQFHGSLSLAELSEMGEPVVEALVKSHAVPALVPGLNGDNPRLMRPCLAALRNIARGTQSQAQAVVDACPWSQLGSLLQYGDPYIRYRVAWLIGDALRWFETEEESLVNAVADGNLLTPLTILARKGLEYVQSAALRAIFIITNYKSPQLVKNFDLKLVIDYCNLLDCSGRDSKNQLILLDIIDNLICISKRTNQFGNMIFDIEDCGGLDKIEQLLSSENDEVFDAATDIIEQHFTENEENQKNNTSYFVLKD